MTDSLTTVKASKPIDVYKGTRGVIENQLKATVAALPIDDSEKTTLLVGIQSLANVNYEIGLLTGRIFERDDIVRLLLSEDTE